MSLYPSNPDEYETLLKGIADANGFALFKQYSEKEAADFLGIHSQTLKQLRLDGKIDFIRIGKRSISYLGAHIGDHIIGSIHWQNQEARNSASGNTLSPADRAEKDGGAHGTMQTESIHAASRLARTTLTKPNSD